MAAAFSGDMDMFDLLLKNKADVKAVNKDGETALLVAVGQGNVEAAKALCDKGADINDKDTKYGMTALMIAADAGDLEMAEVLLSAKAKINETSKDGNTALMFASANDDTDMVNLLVGKGAEVNTRSGSQGLTAADGRG